MMVKPPGCPFYPLQSHRCSVPDCATFDGLCEVNATPVNSGPQPATPFPFLMTVMTRTSALTHGQAKSEPKTPVQKWRDPRRKHRPRAEFIHTNGGRHDDRQACSPSRMGVDA
jgi:hypothetical protein